MAVKTLTNDFYGHGFKIGSTWTFFYTRKAGTPPSVISVEGLSTRVMFRFGSVDGEVVHTVNNAEVENGGLAGTIQYTIVPAITGLFLPKQYYYFDIEMTAVDGFVWQSPTMRFKTEQEVTR